MYQVTVKGRTLAELKKAVSDINDELTNDIKLVGTLNKDMSVTVEEVEETTPVVTPIAELPTAVETPVAPVVHTVIDTPAAPVVHTVIDTPAAPVVSSLGCESDSEGLPWDSRIHTEKRTKTNKGVWKNRRGIDKDLLASVRAELISAVHNAKPATPIAVIPTTPAAPAIVETPVAPVAAPVAPAPVPAAPTVSGGHTLETFTAGFAMILGSLITEGKVTPEYVQTLKEYFKVDEIWNVSEEQKAQMFESFVEYKFIQKA